MSLIRRWVATCDAPGCPTTIIHEPIPAGERADYGEATNDAGWAASPGQHDTFCPQHYPEED